MVLFACCFETVSLYSHGWPGALYVGWPLTHRNPSASKIRKKLERWLSTNCSCRGLRFGSQHPHGGSQTSLTLVPKDPATSSDLLGHQACVWCSETHNADKTLTQNK